MKTSWTRRCANRPPTSGIRSRSQRTAVMPGIPAEDTMPRMSPIDFRSYDALTFDCYGTLIDWETGILTALRPSAPGIGDEALLEAFARHESEIEAGPYLRYA